MGQVAALAPDALVVAAYGRLLPPALLRVPPLGTLNIHPSMLPRYRGPSPVAAAVLAGDEDDGRDRHAHRRGDGHGARPGAGGGAHTPRRYDRGPDGAALPAGGDAAGGDAGAVGARARFSPQPQDDAQATYTRLLRKEDGEVDFREPADRLWRQVRAYTPWPGTHTTWEGRRVKLIDVVPLVSQGVAAEPGEVVALPPSGPAPVGVGTGDGVLGLLRVQIEGRQPVAARDFLAGHAAFVGARLPS